MLIVRNMIESDLEAIASLEKNIFSDAWTAKSIEDTYNQPQAFIMMAELEGKLAGYCIVYFVLDEGEIARIAVDSSFRRQGVGRKLLKQVENTCEEKGITCSGRFCNRSNAYDKHMLCCDGHIGSNTAT